MLFADMFWRLFTNCALHKAGAYQCQAFIIGGWREFRCMPRPPGTSTA